MSERLSDDAFAALWEYPALYDHRLWAESVRARENETTLQAKLTATEAENQRLREALRQALATLEGGFSTDPTKRPESPERWMEMVWATMDATRKLLGEPEPTAADVTGAKP